MRDGWWRRVLKRPAFWRWQVDLALTRLWSQRHGPRFDLGGACNSCGDCCETPVVQVPPWLLRLRSATWLLRAWHGKVNGFESIGMDRRRGLLIFRCTHLDPQTRLCDSYASRPGMCRDYPRNLLDQERPEFLPRCGHCALNPAREALLAEFQALALPPEKLANLRREFYLDDRRDPPQPGA